MQNIVVLGLVLSAQNNEKTRVTKDQRERRILRTVSLTKMSDLATNTDYSLTQIKFKIFIRKGESFILGFATELTLKENKKTENKLSSSITLVKKCSNTLLKV